MIDLSSITDRSQRAQKQAELEQARQLEMNRKRIEATKALESYGHVKKTAERKASNKSWLDAHIEASRETTSTRKGKQKAPTPPPEFVPSDKCSKEQLDFLRAVVGGQNVFLTGPAGS